MIRIGKYLALGLLASGSGCASLQKSATLPAPREPQEVAAADLADFPPPIDPFHPQVQPTGSRIARFFPGLARFDRASSPIGEAARSDAREDDLNLEAVPRPKPLPSDDETTTASLPRRGFRFFRGNHAVRPAPAPAPESAPRVTSAAERRPSVDRPMEREVPEPAVPVLAASVVAEIDPADVVPATREFDRRQSAREEARMASAAMSPRRMPPLPEIAPSEGRPSPSRMALADVRVEARQEDDQARRALRRVDDETASQVVQPLLAVAEDLPRGEDFAEIPPVIEDPSEAAESTEGAVTRKTDEPIVPEPEPVREALADPSDDGPPPIEEPTTHQDRAGIVEPEDPDTGGDPVLAGRPRMSRPSARREDLMEDVPSPSFPRTYYGRDSVGDDAKAPRSWPREDSGPRWTWRPRLLQRLRGK